MRARMEVPARKAATYSSQFSLVVAAHGAVLYATIAATAGTVPVLPPRDVDTIPFVVPARRTGPPTGAGDRGGLPSRPRVDRGVAIDAPAPLSIDGLPVPTDGIVDLEYWASRGLGGGADTSSEHGIQDTRRVDVPPRLLSKVVPEYPAALLRFGIEGRVILDFVVDTTGRVRRETVRVVVASNPAFVEAATKAIVEQARFSPGRVGEPVPTLVRQGVFFKRR